ncbi:MAG: tRNA pseudouridine(55) synthase TruB [Lachnospiraceae bacterium]|nr:tRNA pseudouridine(55) synthase TruB [Lachnospiraceae bacterium]
MYDGIINVYKEKGYTSFDVVARLRGILKQKKIGHTGTLDPDAEGVLVVCLGKATRLCEMLTSKDKSYDAVLLLGKTTDTEDSSGKLLSEKEVNLTEDEVREAVMSFVGEYDQIPPMYSAIKVGGKKLYELARQGIEIDRAPRKVIIHHIDIQEINIPYVRFSVSCGKGTYIRSLCRDIGEKLSCGGIMDGLVRSSVNAADTGMRFELSDALKLDEIEALVSTGDFEEHILTIDKMFPKLVKVKVTAEGDKKLRNGNVLFLRDFECADDINTDNDEAFQNKDIAHNVINDRTIYTLPQKADGADCLVYDHLGTFTAIYRYHENIHGWKAYKMFV